MKSFGLNTFLSIFVCMSSVGPLFAKTTSIPPISLNIFNSFDHWVELSFNSKSGHCSKPSVKLGPGRGTLVYLEVDQCSDLILKATDLDKFLQVVPGAFSSTLALAKIFGYDKKDFKVFVSPNSKQPTKFFLQLQQ